jgi:hypothetical protein
LLDLPHGPLPGASSNFLHPAELLAYLPHIALEDDFHGRESEPIFFSFGKKAPWRIIKKEEIPQAKSRRSK